MPLPVIADTIRVAVEYTMSNAHRGANILHFRKTSGLTFAGAIAILDPILLSHYVTNVTSGRSWVGIAPTTAALTDFRYTPLDGTSATTVITHTNAGGSAAEALPASVSLVVTLRTTLRGRSHRGRVYMGPWTEAANLSAGQPNGADVTGLALQWNGFLSALSGSGVSLVVASYLHSTAQDVSACSVDTRWDTQRRRLNA